MCSRHNDPKLLRNSKADKVGGILWTIFFVSGGLMLLLIVLNACSDDAAYNGYLAQQYITGSKGPVGPQGPTGNTGEPGFTTLFIQNAFDSDTETCESGSGYLLQYGLDRNRNDVLDVGESSGGFVLCNGSDGEDGSDAPPSQYDIVGFIDPCGTQLGGLDEVLIQLSGGDILAHYSDGTNQHLVLLVPGNYVTTDTTHCYFTVTEDGDISNEHF